MQAFFWGGRDSSFQPFRDLPAGKSLFNTWFSRASSCSKSHFATKLEDKRYLFRAFFSSYDLTLGLVLYLVVAYLETTDWATFAFLSVVKDDLACIDHGTKSWYYHIPTLYRGRG